MEKQQVEIDKNVDVAILTNTRQSDVSSGMVANKIIRETRLLPGNLHAEIESLRSLIKELEEELLKRDLSISFLTRDRKILIDENERKEKELENYIKEHWEYFKRKIILL